MHDVVPHDLQRLACLRSMLERRAKIIRATRQFFEECGSLEIETPRMVVTPGTDLNLDPFTVGDRYLITSPEFHMKRLVAAGFHRIHQLCHCFRRDEVGALHNPEFTMLEWYRVGAGYLELASELETMVAGLATHLNGTTLLPDRDVDVELPWQRLTVREAFDRFAGWTPGPSPDPDRFFLDLVEKVEPRLGCGRPTILYEYPASQAILSRIAPEDPSICLRFEVYIDGIEIANAFDELTDGAEQRGRFEEENARRRAEEKPLLPIDEKLLDALDSMPQTSGAALGLDRLVMLLTGAQALEDVMAFTERTL